MDREAALLHEHAEVCCGIAASNGRFNIPSGVRMAAVPQHLPPCRLDGVDRPDKLAH
jgi:hypothetical protein